MIMNELLNMYKSGALNIKYDKSRNIAVIGEMSLSIDKAHQFVNNLGWIEYVLSPFDIIDKTKKFIKAFDTHLDKQGFWETAEVQFQNKHGNTYKSTFDRIVIRFNRSQLVILYNMERSGAKYVIYEDNKAIPAAKCRTLKAVIEFINDYE